MHTHGPWTIQSTREVYRDPWMHVTQDQVTRPDGNPGTFAVVHIKHGVTVVALDDAGNVHLAEEFHYAVGEWTLEGVSGGGGRAGGRRRRGGRGRGAAGRGQARAEGRAGHRGGRLDRPGPGGPVHVDGA